MEGLHLVLVTLSKLFIFEINIWKKIISDDIDYNIYSVVMKTYVL